MKIKYKIKKIEHLEYSHVLRCSIEGCIFYGYHYCDKTGESIYKYSYEYTSDETKIEVEERLHELLQSSDEEIVKMAYTLITTEYEKKLLANKP